LAGLAAQAASAFHSPRATRRPSRKGLGRDLATCLRPSKSQAGAAGRLATTIRSSLSAAAPIGKLPFPRVVPMKALNSYNLEPRKSSPVEAVVERKKAVTLLKSVCADKKVGEDAAGAGLALLAAATSVGLKRAAGGPPDRFIQIPLDGDSGIFRATRTLVSTAVVIVHASHEPSDGLLSVRTESPGFPPLDILRRGFRFSPAALGHRRRHPRRAACRRGERPRRGECRAAQ